MASIRKRGRSYQIRVSCGVDHKGQRIVQTKTWTPSDSMSEKQIKKELNRQSVMFEESCANGSFNSSKPFCQLAEEWLEQEQALKLKPSSLGRLKRIAPRIYNSIGDIRIDKLSAREIQQFISYLSKGIDGKNRFKPLSSKTVKNYLWFISGACNYGIRMDMMSENPCKRVIVPRQEPHEKQIYTQDDVCAILDKLDDEDITYKAFFYLASYSGLRRGELLGLKWDNIDLEQGIVNVNKSLIHTSEIGTVLSSTKTDKSTRFIRISNEVVNVLRELKKSQEQKEKELGNKWIKSGSVFTNCFGDTMGYNTPYNWFEHFCHKNDFPFLGIHAFRHFVASWLIYQGVDIQSVSGTLGHSSSTTTLSIYSHTIQAAQARVSDVMNSAFSPLRQKK